MTPGRERLAVPPSRCHRQTSSCKTGVPMDASAPPRAHAVPRRALVVEDDPDCRAALQLYLRASGLAVAAARDGAQALRMALGWRPHVAIVDLDLPLLGGVGTGDTSATLV